MVFFHYKPSFVGATPMETKRLIFHATAAGTTALRSQGDDQAEGEGAAEDDAGTVVESDGLGVNCGW